MRSVGKKYDENGAQHVLDMADAEPRCSDELGRKQSRLCTQ
ncbi:hypothetical protein [Rhodococcus sp. 24CO]